jgi:hypothetical protein
MNNNHIESKFKEEMSKLKMTETENSLAKKRILNFAKSTISRRGPALSPISYLFHPKMAMALLALLLLVASGPTYYAAAHSLPGDMLYPIKTEVIEEIQVIFTPQKEEATLHLQLTQKRLNETSALTKTSRLEDLEDLTTALEENAAEAIDAIGKDVDSTYIEQVNSYAKLSALIEGHRIITQEHGTATFGQVSTTEQEVDLLLEEALDNYSNETSEDMRVEAVQSLLNVFSESINDLDTPESQLIAESGLTETSEHLEQDATEEALVTLLEAGYLLEALEEIPQ